jgi:hypothetical protein
MMFDPAADSVWVLAVRLNGAIAGAAMEQMMKSVGKGTV